MTMLRKTAWNKGRKMPHSKEWEEERINAVKKYVKNKVYPKGYKRPKEHTQPMLNELKKRMEENPQKYKDIATNNLPKNVSGEKNGNWKGGKTKEQRDFRTQYSTKFSNLRKEILLRDENKCKLCGSSDNLHIHHIIPLSETHLTAFLRMNLITLCKDCHVKTDSYGGKKKFPRKIESGIGNTKMIIRTIPHKFHEYETCGNWQFTEDGVLVVFVSDMGNKLYEWLVAEHEINEALICQTNGIDEKEVSAFDIAFEKLREQYPEIIGDQEPGNMIAAPYFEAHQKATFIERTSADMHRVVWGDYDSAVGAL